MKSVRSLVEKFLYQHIDYYANMMYDGGYDTVIDGIHVLADPFAVGALFYITCELYIHYTKTNDPRTAHASDMLHTFITYMDGREVKTWGQLSVCKGLYALKKADMLNTITNDELAKLEAHIRYTDFLDKETVSLIGYCTNYMQVAFAIASYREKLGLDEGTFSKTIMSKLIAGMGDGWMDDEEGAHRYDRYSILLPSEAVDNFINAGEPVTDSIRKNLSEACKLTLFMANDRGDGVNYGRSLSVHGDLGACEVLSSGLAIGIIDDDKLQLAVDYTIRILEKLFSFWYDDNRHSFNIWLDGRTTNAYRNIERLVEVNVDMASHLLGLLNNFERAGLADTEFADTVPKPNAWTYSRTDFQKDDTGIWSLITLRKDDKMVMIPLIGGGSNAKHSTYQPYPHLCGVVDSCPNADYPFLVPEYTDRFLNILRPTEFYDDITVDEADGKIIITASGTMARMNGLKPWCFNKAFRFKNTYTVDGDKITVKFEHNLGTVDSIMYSGTFIEGQEMTFDGFDATNEVRYIKNPMYRSHHGAFNHVYIHEAHTYKPLSYTVKLY